MDGTIDDNDRICEGTTVQHTQHIYDEENRITSQTSVLGSRSYTSSYVYNDNVAISHAAKKLVRLIYAMQKSGEAYRSAA